MIDKDAFKDAWRKLAARFGKEVNAEQAAMYYEYLSDLMETDEFLGAARAVWAANTFFPRPADFLAIRAAQEWPLVLKCAEGFHPPDWPWAATWGQLSPRAQAACRRLGGMDTIRAAWTKDPTRLKDQFAKAFEEEATAAVLALPTAKPRTLKPVA
jgi:hypothetical protein